MNDGAHMIELTGIHYSWPERPALLSGIDLQIKAGDKLVLMGANGTGKSTLLKLLAGLVFAESGTHTRGGVDITRPQFRNKAWTRDFRANTGLLFQNPDAMLFNPTVRDEIAFGPRRLGWPDADARTEALASTLGLAALLDKAPFALSGGEKQKVALAAVLVLEPALLLLDEPAANLDPRTTGWLAEYLLDTESTVVVSTHSQDFAAEFGERCVILGADGRVAFDGAADTALADAGLLERTGLAWRHRHRHRHAADGQAHEHKHEHEHEHEHTHVHPHPNARRP